MGKAKRKGVMRPYGKGYDDENARAVLVRFTPEQHKVVEGAAEADGMRLATWLRETSLKVAGRADLGDLGEE